MIVKDTGQGDYEKLEPGLHQAVCSHVVDLGMQETPWGDKAQVALCFELAEKMSDGRPFMQSKMYTASLNEKSNLRADLKSWRSKDFTPEELDGFDLDSIIGVNCMLNIIEKHKNDKTYLNIAGITPCLKNLPKIKPVGQPVPEWLQKKAELGSKWDEQIKYENQDAPPPPTDDSDLPF